MLDKISEYIESTDGDVGVWVRGAIIYFYVIFIRR